MLLKSVVSAKLHNGLNALDATQFPIARSTRNPPPEVQILSEVQTQR